jgi:hypothetical protein
LGFSVVNNHDAVMASIGLHLGAGSAGQLPRRL